MGQQPDRETVTLSLYIASEDRSPHEPGRSRHALMRWAECIRRSSAYGGTTFNPDAPQDGCNNAISKTEMPYAWRLKSSELA